MKKILTAITLFCLITALCAISAFAYGEYTAGGSSVTADAAEAVGADTETVDDANGVAAEDTAVNTEDGVTADTHDDTNSYGENDEEREKNSFEEIYGLAVSNADKLFALLAFIASLLVGFAYKKGLIPFVKTALGALGNGVTLLKEETKRAEEAASLALSSAENKLAAAEKNVALALEKLSLIEADLASSREGALRDNELRLILRSQIELLYEIFMSSSLPSYQKDAIGERVAEMKKALEKETESE